MKVWIRKLTKTHQPLVWIAYVSNVASFDAITMSHPFLSSPQICTTIALYEKSAVCQCCKNLLFATAAETRQAGWATKTIPVVFSYRLVARSWLLLCHWRPYCPLRAGLIVPSLMPSLVRNSGIHPDALSIHSMAPTVVTALSINSCYLKCSFNMFNALFLKYKVLEAQKISCTYCASWEFLLDSLASFLH